MPPHPLLRALLRALCFVGLTESIFFRLIPAPAAAATGTATTLVARLHTSAWQAGTVAFVLSYALVIAVLLALSRLALRARIWPAGLNGFIATCLTGIAVLGCAAPWARAEPAFATAFTWFTALILLLLGMHAYGARTGAARLFVVCYAACVLCSACLTTGLAVGRLAPARLLAGAEESGLILFALSGACALLAFADPPAAFRRRRHEAWAATTVAACGALAFAALCLFAPTRLSPLGAHPGVVRVVILSYGLFAVLLAAGLNVLDPESRLRGYGLLLLLLAGFPQRIALQDMLVAGGATLLLAPVRTVPTARLIVEIFGGRSDPRSPPAGPAGDAPGVERI